MYPLFVRHHPPPALPPPPNAELIGILVLEATDPRRERERERERERDRDQILTHISLLLKPHKTMTVAKTRRRGGSGQMVKSPSKSSSEPLLLLP